MDIKEENHKIFLKIMQEAGNLRWSKYCLYGDSYKLFSVQGLAMRMNDKIQRILNILQSEKDFEKIYPLNESLRDSALDLANYAIMFVMEYDDKKEVLVK